MFIHCVHFWLKAELTAAQRADFLQGLRRLADSPFVQQVRVGKPAGTLRPVVDNSYDYQLLVHFADRAAHDAYQSEQDAVHAAFVRKYQPFWTRVLIYDSIEA